MESDRQPKDRRDEPSGWKNDATYILAVVVVVATVVLCFSVITSSNVQWSAIAWATALLAFVCRRFLNYLINGGRK